MLITTNTTLFPTKFVKTGDWSQAFNFVALCAIENSWLLLCLYRKKNDKFLLVRLKNLLEMQKFQPQPGHINYILVVAFKGLTHLRVSANSLLWGAFLCSVGYLAESLAFTHSIPDFLILKDDKAGAL